MPASYSEIVAPGVIRWLESVRYKREGWGRYPFNAKSFAPYSLYASGLAVRLLNELDQLGPVSPGNRDEAASYIKASQDMEDGYFKDRFEDVSVYTGFNSWEEIWNMRSSVVHGLRLLGYAPKRPLPLYRFTDFSSVDPVSWLQSLNWTNPGKCAEIVSSALIAYGESLSPELRNDSVEPFRVVFDFFEHAVVDSGTGLPTRLGASQDSSLITGIARMLSAYIYFGRRFPWPEKVIDYLLENQGSDGDFTGRISNIANCYNGLWILRELNYELEGGHGDDGIQNAGNLAAHGVLDVYRKPDGGFSFNPDCCQDINYSIRVSDCHPVGDMTGTMMAYRCLLFVDEWNSGIIFGKKRRPFSY
ncbi:MAG: hypothetical protein JXB03_02590 [Spirochaetales bacterium]|nr:hypothetical protein [Spirochaetales bacterium]